MSEHNNKNGNDIHTVNTVNKYNKQWKRPSRYNSWKNNSYRRQRNNWNTKNKYPPLYDGNRYNHNNQSYGRYNNGWYNSSPPMFQFIPFYDNPFMFNNKQNSFNSIFMKNHNKNPSNFLFNNIDNDNDTTNLTGNEPRNKIYKEILEYILPKREKCDKELNTEPLEKKFILDPTKEYKLLDKKIETIEDFIGIGKLYDPDVENEYPIDLKRAHKLIEPLTELNNMVGIDSIKQNILELIIYGIQDLTEDNMYHTIIQGPPGTGKTMLGMILAKIYHALGIIENNEKSGIINPITGKKENFVIKVYRRSDLIGKYLGHTAAKTQEAIDSCKGGVMFIDEAYSLGNAEGRDSYSKEAIDTINQNLSENKNKFICIIAGYKNAIEKCFFGYNEGLRRRFSFKYTIDKYTPTELCEILRRKIKESEWKLSEDVDDDKLASFIKTHIQDFENFGGDIETLLLNCKLVHSRRLFGKHPNDRKKISLDDIKNGHKRFVDHKRKKQNDHLLSMYV